MSKYILSSVVIKHTMHTLFVLILILTFLDLYKYMYRYFIKIHDIQPTYCVPILYHNKRFLLISNINESMWYSLSILRAIGLYNQIEFSPDDVITLLISIYPFICCQYLSWHANQVKLLNIHLCTCIFTANVVY